MSLYVDQGSGRRARSSSRAREDTTKPSYVDSRESSYVYPDDQAYRPRHDDPPPPRASSSGLPYPADGGIDHMLPGSQDLYSYDAQRPLYRTASPPAARSSRDKLPEASSHRSSRDRVHVDDAPPGAFPSDDDDDDKDKRRESKRERREKKSKRSSRYAEDDDRGGLDPGKLDSLPSKYSRPSRGGSDDDKLKYLPSKYAKRRDASDDDDDRPKYAKPISRPDPNDDKLKYLPSKYTKRRDSSDDDERPPLPDRRNVRPERDSSSRLDYLPAKYGAAAAAGVAAGTAASHKHAAADEPTGRVDKLINLPQKYLDRYHDRHDSSSEHSRHSDREERHRRKKERDEEDLAYGKPPGPPKDAGREETWGSYMSGSKWEDKHRPAPGRERDDEARRRDSYRRDEYGREHREDAVRPTSPERRHRRTDSYARDDDPRGSRPEVRTVEPRDEPPEKPPRPSDTLQVAGGSSGRDRSRSRDGRGHRREKSSDLLTVGGSSGRERSRSRDGRRDKSPNPPTKRMSSLTVAGAVPAAASLAAAPGSPLLESYRGTYQDCSPMPSPLLLASASGRDDDVRVLEALSPGGSDLDGEGKRRTRRARFHDDSDDIAARMAAALQGSGPPDRGPLLDILPSLTHEQVMELRASYKSLVKTGTQRKGVNVAKHIRARLKDDNPNLMKACYAVALGRWESEAYWANYWYQGDKTRRELLIESLMGRSNADIRRIKDAFTDKKYDNSLTKCMRTELKEDKFKKAVLLVLDERRMDDETTDDQGRRVRLPIDYDLVDRDVDDLWRAVRSEKGGESAMIAIVVQRSDAHLRQVLKDYERAFHSNFARDSLKKSGNLVGELLAHILNGVINRPVRDALLLHHALTTSRKDELRHELLTSRLVRLHWDPVHMAGVRRAYLDRYGVELQHAVRDATSGHWGLFCEELCIARVPSDVRTLHARS